MNDVSARNVAALEGMVGTSERVRSEDLLQIAGEAYFVYPDRLTVRRLTGISRPRQQPAG